MNSTPIPTAGVLVLVHSDEYANWAFSTQHPTQGRRFMNARERLLELAPAVGVTVREVESDLLPAPATLELVHDPSYVQDVIVEGLSNEWSGPRPDLGVLASRMAGGTLRALEELLAGRTLTAVNFAGAKHHAQWDRSSGFCVFADFALAAKVAASAGRRVAILDIDAHHGDGTESLLRGDESALTFSVHDRTIFPGTGREDDPSHHMYNEPLAAGSGDVELRAAAERFIGLATDFEADLVFIAMGADGHRTDPLSTLRYSMDGMVEALGAVRSAFPDLPFLLGGAGGYQPDDVTPEVWARMAIAACACVTCVDLSVLIPDPREGSALRPPTLDVALNVRTACIVTLVVQTVGSIGSELDCGRRTVLARGLRIHFQSVGTVKGRIDLQCA